MFTTLKKIILNFFKVSGCKQFILATFKYNFLKVSQVNVYLNVAQISWLQPLTLKNVVNSMNIFFQCKFAINSEH